MDRESALTVAPYNVDCRPVSDGAYSPLTTSMIDVVNELGLPVIVQSSHFTLVGEGDVRWLIGRASAFNPITKPKGKEKRK